MDTKSVLDEQAQRKKNDAINRLLRGETSSWTSANGTTYRRVWRDGIEYWEQSYADGITAVDEITPSLRESFLKLAATDGADDTYRLFREGGLPLPGDPKAPKQN